MPEDPPSHGHEGWRAYERPGYALAAALYALTFVGCLVAAVLFALYFPGHNPRPWPQPFPQPRLNGRIDRDPEFSYAPRPVPASAVDPAMRALAAEGDAGWGPQGGSTSALERVPAKWLPVRRQGRAPARESGAFPGSSEPGKALGARP
jgi:hypothetical protein